MNIIIKIILFIIICLVMFFIGAYIGSKRVTHTCETKLTREQVKERSFDQLFKPIDPKQVTNDIFTLISEDCAVVTAGTPEHYNSMVAGWGGWGVIFQKPTTFLMLRSNRYTLELMRQQQTYTLTFFDDDYKPDFMPFGQSSGRDNPSKMTATTLTPVQSNNGLMTYKEAKLIIECKLVQVTSVSPDDFYTDFSKKFIQDAFEETGDYHKVVFGEISRVWVRG